MKKHELTEEEMAYVTARFISVIKNEDSNWRNLQNLTINEFASKMVKSLRPERSYISQNLDNYPLYLRARHIMEILGVGHTTANAYMNELGSGVIKTSPRVKLWPKEKFLEWLDKRK